jgi:hypothetical protein
MMKTNFKMSPAKWGATGLAVVGLLAAGALAWSKSGKSFEQSYPGCLESNGKGANSHTVDLANAGMGHYRVRWHPRKVELDKLNDRMVVKHSVVMDKGLPQDSAAAAAADPLKSVDKRVVELNRITYEREAGRWELASWAHERSEVSPSGEILSKRSQVVDRAELDAGVMPQSSEVALWCIGRRPEPGLD